MKALHSSKEDKWYTPIPIIESARNVLGTIDVDPFSDEFGNSRVKAKLFHGGTLTCGFKDWWCYGSVHPPFSVFMNPPGGKTEGRSNAARAWEKLMHYRDKDMLSHAIVIGFSLNILQTSQDPSGLLGHPSAFDFPLCVPSKRLKYDTQNGPSKSPPHPSCVIYVPGTIEKIGEFYEEFSQYGAVRI